MPEKETRTQTRPFVERRPSIDNVAVGQPSVWGFKPRQIHDLYWAARGLQVVRPGDKGEITEAPRFLLLPRFALVNFELHRLAKAMRRKRQLEFAVLKSTPIGGYRESVITDSEDRFLRYQRDYPILERGSTRMVLTTDREAARIWQEAADSQAGEVCLRRYAARPNGTEIPVSGVFYDGRVAIDVERCIHDVMIAWGNPGMAVSDVKEVAKGVWADKDSTVEPSARIAGPVWLGAGRHINRDASILGPAILWDDPAAPCTDGPVPRVGKPAERVEAKTHPGTDREARPTRAVLRGKRVFDIAFSLVAIALTLPFYPLIWFAIWLEDGRPFFFAHRRETLGGREFRCWKFRSMRNDAEELKAKLQSVNEVDGPQFFMENDPRLTKVGRYLRSSKLDELPQFFNVLAGQMSVVGPRPSPVSENQYCPSWREARLSVYPGITGLWQLKRTREPGADFQEWVRYDIEYVDNLSWRLDFAILLRTIVKVLRELV